MSAEAVVDFIVRRRVIIIIPFLILIVFWFIFI